MFNGLKSEYHVAEQHACYTGAINAEALHKLLSFAMKDHLEVLYDNKAYTITAEFDVRGGILRMYAHRLLKPLVLAGSIEYWMTQFGIFFGHGSLVRTRFDDESPPFKMLRTGQGKERGFYSRCNYHGTKERYGYDANSRRLRKYLSQTCRSLQAVIFLKEKVCQKNKGKKKRPGRLYFQHDSENIHMN